jgi:hypothetical protein
MLDISEGGLSFGCLEGRPPVRRKTRLAHAVIQTGGWTILGELEVTYVSRAPDSRRVCGARFLPASEGDRVKLKTLVASLHAPAPTAAT